MADRKSPPSQRPAPASTSAEAVRGSPHPDEFAGDSETHFTPAELARLVAEVWEHGRVMPEADAATWRQDECGAWILRDHFGREDSEFGWKIERVSIESEGKGARLRPFHVRNEFDIANGRAHCAISADREHVPAERQAGPPRNKHR